MEDLNFRHAVAKPAGGTRQTGLVGVVASGNLEVLSERVLADNECVVAIRTTAAGFADVWAAVVADFVERHPAGGIRFSINDGGARPDTVSLRLAQALRLMEVER
ncbi:malonate decarboxylase acyl carrier protein [Martelella soudanensis]|uniref:malonate decarboxylase acyl carrier protein n=1 Tax=unclassified Martelella TaxID=2629616 RepID=UPI0015E011E1|nr:MULTISPECIES: malonate decarboxylase acyl carrier protein [unclassified Martelella]